MDGLLCRAGYLGLTAWKFKWSHGQKVLCKSHIVLHLLPFLGQHALLMITHDCLCPLTLELLKFTLPFIVLKFCLKEKTGLECSGLISNRCAMFFPAIAITLGTAFSDSWFLGAVQDAGKIQGPKHPQECLLQVEFIHPESQ